MWDKKKRIDYISNINSLLSSKVYKYGTNFKLNN